MTALETAIATVTLARNEAEEAALRQSLACLSTLGIPIVVADGGSPARFLSFVRGLPHIEVAENVSVPGLVAQARLALRTAAAYHPRAILYTEPDKTWFFRAQLLHFVASSSKEDAGVILASRSAASLLTYPASQQLAEGMLNRVCAEETGLVADYSYGPFMVKPSVVDALDAIPTTLGWGWRTYLFIWAHKHGHRLRHIEGDFICPTDSRADSDSERHHRVRQLAQNLAGVVCALD